MATASTGKDDPRSVLQNGAAALRDRLRDRNPAEEVIAGKVKRTRQGIITGVTVWPLPAIPGKARSDNLPKVDQVEIDNIGKVFNTIRRQPAGRKGATVGFTFRGEEYQAKREECMTTGAHVRGAVCFSGSKPSPASRGIYAMMTQDGYVIIVKTSSFTITQAAVEGSKGVVHNVQSAAIRAATRK